MGSAALKAIAVADGTADVFPCFYSTRCERASNGEMFNNGATELSVWRVLWEGAYCGGGVDG